MIFRIPAVRITKHREKSTAPETDQVYNNSTEIGKRICDHGTEDAEI